MDANQGMPDVRKGAAMLIENDAGWSCHVNPAQICYVYKTKDGTRCVEMANGDRLYPTPQSYGRILAWMERVQ